MTSLTEGRSLMKQHELFSYAYDFISQLMDHEEIIKKVRAIILFGSVVRGDFHPESDIDLFIDIPGQATALESLVRKEISLFEKRIEKTWLLRNINPPLKILVGDLRQQRWGNLKDELSRYGKIIYGTYEEKPGKLRHHLLITYEPKTLQQKHKMAFLRALLGYRSYKGKKEYIQKGLLDQMNGTKIGSNAILINREQAKEIKAAFQKHKVKYAVKEVWSE